MNHVEVAVIGGGAAGIAAARTLNDAGVETLILEASNRLGGRAHTIHIDRVPLDLGAGWLHSAQHNPWVAVAEASGFTVDRTLPRWREQWRELGFSKAEQQAAGAAFESFVERMRADPPPTDRAADALLPGCEWNGYLDALSGYINGAGNAEVSITDYLAYDDAATNTDWRVREGYGTLVAAHGAGLRMALATPVTAIHGSAARLRIDTPGGTIEADAAIITVSTNVLASGVIRFDAALDPVLHAAARLPLGLADKLFLALDGAEDVPPNAHLLGNPREAITATYTLRPLGRPVIEAMFGGEGARAMEAEGLDGAAAFAIDELCALLGNDWRKRLRLIAGTAWGREDFIRGGYSHALPGEADARRMLTTPVDPRIHFAGEACSPDAFSTAHGAYQTGVDAARALMKSR
ncbi:FAD-dependent oxidoreductase [Sphingomonas psychrotolerans]|uniref:Tryptophan 2-monooxygenase n=1 Tax=Sphingomonas psychrotolerans TaxID=1327635 RepID=A0ABU3MZ48_9SPHN|nr:NAD(P)/FAD-dependent oxidoreductase [Sphingomonas psychrotolerans]MDT8757564.1 FAD-dependent oxidoreductase [Sphingomonas psychrotolerans]